LSENILESGLIASYIYLHMSIYLNIYIKR